MRHVLRTLATFMDSTLLARTQVCVRICGLGLFGAVSLHAGSAAAQFDIMIPEQTPIPIEAFYEVLRDYGTWIDSDRYGTIFCPHPDVVGADFQPYSRGHWTMSEHGWAFVSSSRISWVTDHYGRWVEAALPRCSWAWSPGSDWAPAWVEWRVSDRVIAWRPKPYVGAPIHMRLPSMVLLPHVKLPDELSSRDSRDVGFIAVNDNDFTARRIENVALAGSQLYAALRDTEPLRDPRAGLHSVERQQIAARVEAKRAAIAEAKAGKSDHPVAGSGPATAAVPTGAAPDPARRRKPGSAGGTLPGLSGLGSAATLRAGAAPIEPPKSGLDKLNLSGPKPGETPPNRTNMTTGSSAGNPGELSGAKVLEWGAPEKKPASKPPNKPESKPEQKPPAP